jgi:hypothetical protein
VGSNYEAYTCNMPQCVHELAALLAVAASLAGFESAPSCIPIASHSMVAVGSPELIKMTVSHDSVNHSRCRRCRARPAHAWHTLDQERTFMEDRDDTWPGPQQRECRTVRGRGRHHAAGLPCSAIAPLPSGCGKGSPRQTQAPSCKHGRFAR